MSSSSRCVLQSIETPSLNGLAIGLRLQDGQASLDEDFFPCCHGSGRRDIDANPPANTMHPSQAHCSVKSRLHMVNELLSRYQYYWPETEGWPHQLSPSRSAVILRKVSDVMKGFQPQAHVSYAKRQKPSLLWSLAQACCWRFGLPVHIACFNKEEHLLPAPEKQRSCQVLMIEKIDKLWDPRHAERLESVVSYAYNSNCLLWLEFLQADENSSPQPNVPSYSKTKAVLSRLQKLQKRDPLEYLEAHSHSKLMSMTHCPRTDHIGVQI